jgi:hypothetical protein
MSEPTTHPGSCHCGAVRFLVKIDATAGTRCNCSICQKDGLTAAIVKPEALTVIAGEDQLSTYEWGSKAGKRFFCKHCGIACFARGVLEQLGGAYASIPLNSLDDVDLAEVEVTYWDGRHYNWEAGARPTPWPVFREGEARPTESPLQR